MNQKGLAPILIVVLIAALAAGGYFIYKLPRTAVPPQAPQTTQIPTQSSTPDETANWKTYKYKTFSVRLSDRWVPPALAGETLNDALKKIVVEEVPFTAKDDPYSLTFQVTNDPYPLEEVVSNTRNVKNITLDKQPAVKFLTIAGQAGDIYQPTVQSNYDGKRFMIYISTKSNEAVADKEFDQILSTFRFLP